MAKTTKLLPEETAIASIGESLMVLFFTLYPEVDADRIVKVTKGKGRDWYKVHVTFLPNDSDRPKKIGITFQERR